jgi:hypothetical protein
MLGVIGSDFPDSSPLSLSEQRSLEPVEDQKGPSQKGRWIDFHDEENLSLVHPMIVSSSGKSWCQRKGMPLDIPQNTKSSSQKGCDEDGVLLELPSPGRVGEKPLLLKKLTEGRHAKEPRTHQKKDWKSRGRITPQSKWSSSSEALCDVEEDCVLNNNEEVWAATKDRCESWRSKSLPSSVKMRTSLHDYHPCTHMMESISISSTST